MLTRIYRYRIRAGSEAAYLRLQEEALRVYRRHVEVEALFLRDDRDPLAKTEVLRFFGADPEGDLLRVDADPEIQVLFETFQRDILDPQHPDIEAQTLRGENLSAMAKLHHVEINCSDLDKTREFWGWLFEFLGYRLHQTWKEGFSFKLGDTYIVFVQAPARYRDAGFHRQKPGLNHLAFHAPSRAEVNRLTELLRARGVPILYPDRHPHAGGPKSYAVFFEDPERIKIEFVV